MDTILETDQILQIENVGKSYGRKPALTGLSFTIGPNQIVGLLGPNGSGKTTLLKLVNTLITDYSGKIRVCGHPPGLESKKLVSYLPDKPFLRTDLKIRTAVDMYKDFYEDFDRNKALEMLKTMRYGVLFLLLGCVWLSGLAVSLIGNTYLSGFFLTVNVLVSLFFVAAYCFTSIQFFYNALASDESYFGYTIPVNTISLVFSKLAAVWMWGAAMAGALVITWFTLYHTLMAQLGMVGFVPPEARDVFLQVLNITFWIVVAQFVMLSCLLAFSISVFNTPKLKTMNAGVLLIAVAAYLLSQVVGTIQVVLLYLWQFLTDPDIFSAIWHDDLQPGQEMGFLNNTSLIVVSSSLVFALLFFWLSVRTAGKHRSI